MALKNNTKYYINVLSQYDSVLQLFDSRLNTIKYLTFISKMTSPTSYLSMHP